MKATRANERIKNLPGVRRMISGVGVFCFAVLIVAAVAHASTLYDDKLIIKAYYEHKSGDYSAEFKDFHEAAVDGSAIAQYYLGLMYGDGIGMPSNYPLAHKWLLRSAQQHFLSAEKGVSADYSYGKGVKKNNQEAFFWMKDAADRWSDARAQYYVGRMYAEGDGIPANFVLASKYYMKAAEQGYAYAQFALVGAYYFGAGVPKNPIEAYKWLSIARAGSTPSNKFYATSSEYLSDMEKTMTPAQLSKAQEEAKDWWASHYPSKH